MKIKLLSFIVLLSIVLLSGCAESPQAQQPNQLAKKSELSIATFAGGCFWCTESDFEKIAGVHYVDSGFSGGSLADPSYKQVSSGRTGHVEAVQVYFDPDVVSYKELVEALWHQVNPTDNEGQFVDRGKHYRSLIFYHNKEQQQQAEQSKQALEESGRYDKPVVTEITAYKSFYLAEDYHQDYYKKNPLRYKYYRYNSGRDQYLSEVWGDDLKPKSQQAKQYAKPADEVLRKKLTPLQYNVTQNSATESAFNNLYWDEKRAGIYVDIVSGEPLFSSLDKYKSGTGWPSFSQPLKTESIVEATDYYLIYPRTELRSKQADSHLGHLFTDGPLPTGLRYCINSASLRFISVAELQTAGYSEYVKLFETNNKLKI